MLMCDRNILNFTWQVGQPCHKTCTHQIHLQFDRYVPHLHSREALFEQSNRNRGKVEGKKCGIAFQEATMKMVTLQFFATGTVRTTSNLQKIMQQQN